MALLIPIKKKMPAIKPITAGIKENLPSELLASIAGIIRLHTLAASITPPAKPESAF